MNYREKVLSELRTRCRHLKTKAAFLGLPDPADVENDLDTAIWWCEKTAEPLGPDGSAAERRRCNAPGRSCYDAP